MARAKTAPDPTEAIINEVNKALGVNALRRASDPAYVVRYIPTGLLPIDILLQGGFPRGRFTVLTGDWSTLKSYIGYNAIKKCQQAGGLAGLIDTERAFDPLWAEHIGIDVDKLLIYPPRDSDITVSGEMAVDAAEVMIRNKVDLLVFDSVAAALPEAERKKRLHDENTQPARLAALMSAASRKLTAANSNTAVVWINQLREQVGVVFGNPEKMTGGRALPYYSSYIVQIKKTGKITRDIKIYTGEKWQGAKEQIGQQFRAEVQKSKLNKPFREIWFNWSLEQSQIDMVSFLNAQGVELGLVRLKGNTWSFGTYKAVGRAKWLAKVASTPALFQALEDAVMDAHGLSDTTARTVSRRKTLRKKG